jgi:hypothetical protein
VPDRSGRRSIDLAPSAAVHSVTFAVLASRTDAARARRAAAGKHTLEYGAYAAHRWQDKDVPADLRLPVAQPAPLRRPAGHGARLSRHRGRTSGLRFSGRLAIASRPRLAFLHAAVEQPSLIPGVLYRDPATSNQVGGGARDRVRRRRRALSPGLDAGYASGDAAPGFGAIYGVNRPAPGGRRRPRRAAGEPPRD